jgi:hypothetical protein
VAGERTKSGTPEAELPEIAGDLRPPSADGMRRTLVGELMPVVDEIRELASEFGIRPYRCSLVHVRWTGGERGAGDPVELSRVEVLPVPRLRDMDATTEILGATGLSEAGGVVVDRISARYTEDDLMGRRMSELADPMAARTNLPDVEFYWEIQESRASDPPPPRRRYVPRAVPMLSRDGLHWRVALSKVDYDSGRDGRLGYDAN